MVLYYVVEGSHAFDLQVQNRSINLMYLVVQNIISSWIIALKFHYTYTIAVFKGFSLEYLHCGLTHIISLIYMSKHFCE